MTHSHCNLDKEPGTPEENLFSYLGIRRMNNFYAPTLVLFAGSNLSRTLTTASSFLEQRL